MKNEDFYRMLRTKIMNWSKRGEKGNLWVKYLLLAPDFFYLLCKLIIDEGVSPKAKLKLIMVISYFITPLDLIPDFLFSVGFLDDIVVTSYVLKSLLDDITPEVLNKYWLAKRDAVEVIDEINKTADKIIGKNVLKEIKVLFSGDNI